MWQDVKNIYHLLMAFLANLWFGSPSKKLTVIGVTGTDGKTTTVNLIYHILKSAGRKVSMISSVGAVIKGKVYETGFHVTTPSSWQLQKLLKEVAAGPAARSSQGAPASLADAANADARLGRPPLASPAGTTPRYLVLEVTSHALDQNRVFGIKFDIGVLTNVTHEHLDYHKNYEEYVRTKFKLLQMTKIAILNKDDESYKLLNSKFKIQNSKLQVKSQKLITYGMGEGTDVNPKNFSFKTKLLGEFNRYNILAAIAVCKELGLTDQEIRRGISSFEAPIGRGEVVHENDFTVMIDFAHTPNALEQLLSSLRLAVAGRIIHVFGSAGERDRQKRPEMGRISAKYADIIVLTAEDPRSESIEKIIGEIESGITNYESRIKKGILLELLDREKAIIKAVQMAKKGDFILLTGKGHERSMNYGKGEVPWSEHEAVNNALKR